MSEHLSKEENAAYQALMRVVFAVPRAVTADIAPVCGLGLSEYMVLEILSKAPNRQLRITELAFACGLSSSGISRIIIRLDREGLTRRVRSREDARGTVAVLTDAGQASLEQVYPLHLTSIRRHIFQHLSAVDLARFTSSMECIADSLLADIIGRSDWGPDTCRTLPTVDPSASSRESTAARGRALEAGHCPVHPSDLAV